MYSRCPPELAVSCDTGGACRAELGGRLAIDAATCTVDKRRAADFIRLQDILRVRNGSCLYTQQVERYLRIWMLRA